jgi:hypothetical protein
MPLYLSVAGADAAAQRDSSSKQAGNAACISS